MLSFLLQILHGILDLPFLIIDLLVDVVNALIEAIAALAQFLIDLLPAFPEPPAEPDGGILGWLLWMVPLGAMLAAFTVLISLWIGFLAIKTALNWMRVL